jgi:predicted  nucleic acid-binding Zn-ribbon protein
MARPPSIAREDETEPPARDNRVDVVDVVPAIAPSPMVTLRRELARLSQQAVAVERSLEAQGRDRRDALDRLDRAAQHVVALEVRLAASEAEAQSMRRLHEAALDALQKTCAERDEHALAIQTARTTTEDLARSRADLERLKTAHEELMKRAATLEAELAEVRRRQFDEALRATDQDTEVGKLRDHIVRAEQTATQEHQNAQRCEEECVKARHELSDERDLLVKTRDELAAVRAELARERSEAQARIERLTRETEVAAKATAEQLQLLQKAQAEVEDLASAARNALARAKAELEAMRADRDAADERTTRLETELSSARGEETLLREEVEMARTTATAATTRAEAAERGQATLAHGMKQLLEEVVAGFARSGISRGSGASATALPPEPQNVASEAPNAQGAKGEAPQSTTSL